MLAVDGDQLCSRCRTQRLHHGTGRDEALLVGQPEGSTTAQGLERDVESGKAHDAVDDHVGGVDDIGQGARDLHTGQRCCNPHTRRFVGHDHELWRQEPGLLDDHVGGGSDRQRGHHVVVRFGEDDVDRLGADGAG